MVPMDLNINQMKELIDLFEGSNLSEISVQQDDFQVTLKKDSSGELKAGTREIVSGGETDNQSRSGMKTSEQGAESEEDQPEVGNQTTEETPQVENAITSPIVGTFYRSPSPEDPPYVEIGDSVEEGDTVCIVEAMKVMNEVKAETRGKVAEICVDEGDSVEYGQKLFKLSPPEKAS
jgi:acetyl-CoA carboxylase biotin carboxyl carrier protein